MIHIRVNIPLVADKDVDPRVSSTGGMIDLPGKGTSPQLALRSSSKGKDCGLGREKRWV